MANKRREPVQKSPEEILADVFSGYAEANAQSPADAKKYLARFLDKFNSIPNAVKFFIYDLLADAAFKDKDMETCSGAIAQAHVYLDAAREEAERSFNDYRQSIRFLDRAITIAVNNGEFEKAVSLCDEAISLDLGRMYETKKASIERMV
ncbi:MAG: hypothetical protein HZC28_17690 [Spirochaetes bacterium]|nr:hypothetical protein [Spirochaetota bacterium]